jgi:hypothetical protein
MLLLYDGCIVSVTTGAACLCDCIDCHQLNASGLSMRMDTVTHSHAVHVCMKPLLSCCAAACLLCCWAPWLLPHCVSVAVAPSTAYGYHWGWIQQHTGVKCRCRDKTHTCHKVTSAAV